MSPGLRSRVGQYRGFRHRTPEAVTPYRYAASPAPSGPHFLKDQRDRHSALGEAAPKLRAELRGAAAGCRRGEGSGLRTAGGGLRAAAAPSRPFPRLGPRRRIAHRLGPVEGKRLSLHSGGRRLAPGTCSSQEGKLSPTGRGRVSLRAKSRRVPSRQPALFTPRAAPGTTRAGLPCAAPHRSPRAAGPRSYPQASISPT